MQAESCGTQGDPIAAVTANAEQELRLTIDQDNVCRIGKVSAENTRLVHNSTTAAIKTALFDTTTNLALGIALSPELGRASGHHPTG
ncbi:hypothetical protein NKDENANG_03637 [Candidatus Entotheonellaceae bacterium PAL068K]